jgi:hypothetical protein
LSVHDIGFFYLDFESNICFEPQQDQNFLTTSFGLMPLAVHTIPAPQEVKRQPVFTDRTMAVESVPARASKQYRRLITPFLAAILFVGALAFFVSGLRMEGLLTASAFGSETRGSYVPLTYPPLGLVETIPGSNAYVADANGIATLQIDDKLIAVNAIPLATSESIGVKKDKIDKNHFEIVVGCFSVLQNANRLIKALRANNLKTSIAEKNNRGLYIVSQAGFESKKSAIESLDNVKQVVPGAWVRPSH